MDNQKPYGLEESSNGFENLDIEKLKSVFLRSLPIILLLIIASVSVSSVILRYTKQLFQSSSVLQLAIKNEASTFGFKSFDGDINDLAREVEIIKSKLFLSKVAETLNYDISYYQYGDVLFEERYGNAPFEITHLQQASRFYKYAPAES